MSDLASRIVARLEADRAWLLTVESCTGGRIADRITNVPGASLVFWGALVTYENSAKSSLVKVSPDRLERYGAVSAEIATDMALGGLAALTSAVGRQSRPLWSLATTGTAGPGGGTAERPVGTCFIAIAGSALKKPIVLEIAGGGPGDREAFKERFAHDALKRLLNAIETKG